MIKQVGCFERPNFIMLNRNRKSYRKHWLVKLRNRWLVQYFVTGAGLDCPCETDSHWCAGLVAAVVRLVVAGGGR